MTSTRSPLMPMATCMKQSDAAGVMDGRRRRHHRHLDTGWYVTTKLVILLLLLGSSQAYSHSSTVLLKTSESFKVTDLLITEIRIRVATSSPRRHDDDDDSNSGEVDDDEELELIGTDASTGSALVRVDGNKLWGHSEENKNVHHRELPSFLRRSYDWMGNVIAEASTAKDLVDQIKVVDSSQLPDWTLHFWRLTSQKEKGKKRDRPFSKNTLTCAISQVIDSPAALLHDRAKTSLCIVDALDFGRIFLLETRQLAGAAAKIQPTLELTSTTKDTMLKKWAGRPFPYSSAINPKIAEIVMDMLFHRTAAHHRRPVTLLDPTCGSGTFLAWGLFKGVKTVIGWDSNRRCVDGTMANLDHLLLDLEQEGSLKQQDQAIRVEHRDSTIPYTCQCFSSELPVIDIVACNFPWGRNSVLYRDTLRCILANVAKLCVSGTPCAFVSKEDISNEIQEQGYDIVDTAHVPPKGFHLPKAKGRKYASLPPSSSKSNCIVTIAQVK